MAILRIQSQGLAEIAKKLQGDGFEKAVQEGVTEGIAVILGRIRRRFLQTKSPDGTYWEPSYAAFYRSMMGRDGDTLFDTGTLFHSIQAYAVNPYTGAIGTDVPYARIHNEGLGGMPRREFLGFSDADQNLAVNVMKASIEEALK